MKTNIDPRVLNLMANARMQFNEKIGKSESFEEVKKYESERLEMLRKENSFLY